MNEWIFRVGLVRVCRLSALHGCCEPAVFGMQFFWGPSLWEELDVLKRRDCRLIRLNMSQTEPIFLSSKLVSPIHSAAHIKFLRHIFCYSPPYESVPKSCWLCLFNYSLTSMQTSWTSRRSQEFRKGVLRSIIFCFCVRFPNMVLCFLKAPGFASSPQIDLNIFCLCCPCPTQFWFYFQKFLLHAVHSCRGDPCRISFESW